MTDILSQRFKPSPDAFANAIGEETVLLQVRRSEYFGFAEIGTQIWSAIKQGILPAEACEGIATDYGVPLEMVRADARAFLEELKANEIIVAE